MKKLTRDHSYSYFFVNAFGMFFGGILTLITAPFFEVAPTVITLMEWPFLLSLFLLILIGNVICFNLYGYLLQKYSATILSFFGFITPLFTAFFDWIWFGQIV